MHYCLQAEFVFGTVHNIHILLMDPPYRYQQIVRFRYESGFDFEALLFLSLNIEIESFVRAFLPFCLHLCPRETAITTEGYCFLSK